MKSQPSDPAALERQEISMRRSDIERLAEAIRGQVSKFSDRRLNDGDDVWREREIEYRRGIAETANAICAELGLDAEAFAAACGLYVSDGRDSYSDCHPGELTWEFQSTRSNEIEKSPEHTSTKDTTRDAHQYGFEYTVMLAVSIPLAWATLLKEASKHHYDARCREIGEQGVINALYNTAYDGPWPSHHPVSFSNLNIVSKVAEQLQWHTDDHALIIAIRAWLRTTMDAIAHQRTACMELPGSAKDHE